MKNSTVIILLCVLSCGFLFWGQPVHADVFSDVKNAFKKIDDLNRKLNDITVALTTGIGRTLGEAMAVRNEIMRAINEIKSTYKPQFDKAKTTGEKMAVITMMVEVSNKGALQAIQRFIDNIGENLIRPFDNNAYKQTEDTAKAIKDLIDIIKDVVVSLQQVTNIIKEIERLG